AEEGAARGRIARDGPVRHRRPARADRGGSARGRCARLEGEVMGLLSWLKKGASDAPQPAGPGDEPESVPELAEALSSGNGAARVDAARALLDRWRSGDLAAAEAVVGRLAGLLEGPE